MRRVRSVVLWVLTATAAFAAAGYLIGFAGGVAMTFANNNYMDQTAQGSYIFWGKFLGVYGLMVATPLGLFVGFVVGLSKELKEIN